VRKKELSVTPRKEIHKQKRVADVCEEHCLQYLNANAYVSSSIPNGLKHPYWRQFLCLSPKFLVHAKKITKIRILISSLTPWSRVLDNLTARYQPINASFMGHSVSHYCIHKSPTLILSPIEMVHIF
jgi:hypothetical protein